MKLTDVSSGSLNQIVFENRNKVYGAYALRRDHDKRVILAFFMVSGFLFMCLYTPYFIHKLNYNGNVVLKDDTQIWDTIIVNIQPPVSPPEKIKTEQHKTSSSSKKLTGDVSTEIKNDSKDTTTMPVDMSQASNPNKGKVEDSLTGLTSSPTASPVSKKSEPSASAEIMPEFPGGEKAMMEYLSKNIRYPVDAKIAGLKGAVHVKFVVEEDGSVTNITILKGIGMGCEQEVVRVTKSMPKWTPGKNGNEPVRVYFNLPVNFKIK